MLVKAEGRKAEAVKDKNIEKVESEKIKIQTIETKVADRELYNTGATKDKNSNLLGFK